MIREATLNDIPKVCELSKALFLDPSSASDIYADANWPVGDSGKEAFKGALDDGFLWVAEIDSEVVGFICAEMSPLVEWRPIRRVELLSFYINPEQRSKGFGKQLVEKLVDWSRDQGAKTIFVSAYADNERGIDFYKTMGFQDYAVELEREI